MSARRREDLAEARVALSRPPGFHYVVTEWGIWRAGGIAVPLAVSHPPPELAYVIRDAEAEAVVVHPDFAPSCKPCPSRRWANHHTDEAVGTAPCSRLPG